MQWIEGMSRQGGKLALQVVDESGGRDYFSPATIPSLKCSTGKRRRKRFITNFDDWGQASAKEYLSGMGFAHQVEERQTVFEIRDEEIRYLLPSQLLIKALFRPYGHTADKLFKPHGLEQIVYPDGETEHGLKPIGKKLGAYSGRVDTALAPLAWYWYQVSARQCWNSVYSYAAAGKLGFQLPVGKVKLVATGYMVGTVCHVVDVTILTIETDEPSVVTNRPGTKTVTFHEQVNNGTYSGGIPATFTLGKDNKTLSDCEWNAIKTIFSDKKSHAHQKHDVRAQVEGILVKLVTGITWRNVAFNSGTWINAAERYRTWRRSGAWERAIDILSNISTSSQTN
jgi:hypothetical protein